MGSVGDRFDKDVCSTLRWFGRTANVEIVGSRGRQHLINDQIVSAHLSSESRAALLRV